MGSSLRCFPAATMPQRGKSQQDGSGAAQPAAKPIAMPQRASQSAAEILAAVRRLGYYPRELKNPTTEHEKRRSSWPRRSGTLVERKCSHLLNSASLMSSVERPSTLGIAHGEHNCSKRPRSPQIQFAQKYKERILVCAAQSMQSSCDACLWSSCELCL